MPLSDKERQMLDSLLKKKDEPEAPPVGRSLRANIDLGDPKQVKMAQKYGFLPPDEEEEASDEKTDDGEETPKRGGYFGGDK